MLENEMVANDQLWKLYQEICLTSNSIKLREDYLKNLRSQVKELMGEREKCYDTDDPDTRKLLFSYLAYPDYWRVDEEELRESAPLIWESHAKIIKGGRRLITKTYDK